jgi:MFS family permease
MILTQTTSTEASSGDVLSPEERARGRRIAIASHPAAMTHRLVYTEQLPTLALVSLGASEWVVGLQRGFEPFGQLLQLPTLRLVGRFSKRSVLIGGQLIAVVGGLPMVAYALLSSGVLPWPLMIALLSFATAAAGLVVSQTVWFPLLREYVEAGGIGRFFGLLRTGWHLTLIGYYVAAQRWLAAYPGSFAPLFAVATACGLLRIVLVARLPEAPAETGRRIRVREVLGVLLRDARLRAYLCGVGLCGAARRVVIPFSIVLMRRVLGMAEGEVLLATVAYFSGGFVSLYLWGRVVDRYGPRLVFFSTGGTLAAAYCALVLTLPAAGSLQMIATFFTVAVLSSGFDVADTHVRFSIAPEDAPLRHLVVADVASSLIYGSAPLLTGLLLDIALSADIAPAAAYRAIFAGAAAATLLSLVPLRQFKR